MSSNPFDDGDDPFGSYDEIGISTTPVATPAPVETPVATPAPRPVELVQPSRDEKTPSRVSREPRTTRPRATPPQATSTRSTKIMASTDGWPSIGPYDVEMGSDSPRTKIALMVTNHLAEVLRTAQMSWTIMAATNGLLLHSTPTGSGFREGLIRVGLSHINDPALLRLVPPDGRRHAALPDDAELPEVENVVVPRWAAGIAWELSGESGRSREHLYLPPELSEVIDKARTDWWMAHPVFVQLTGALPGNYAFIEGLLRLGLRHVADERMAQFALADRRVKR